MRIAILAFSALLFGALVVYSPATEGVYGEVSADVYGINFLPGDRTMLAAH